MAKCAHGNSSPLECIECLKNENIYLETRLQEYARALAAPRTEFLKGSNKGPPLSALEAQRDAAYLCGFLDSVFCFTRSNSNPHTDAAHEEARATVNRLLDTILSLQEDHRYDRPSTP